MHSFRGQAAALILLFQTAALPASAASLEEKRQAFVEAHAAAELGDFSLARDRAEILRDYVLWPDLRAAFLRTRLRSGVSDELLAEIAGFLARHEALRPARELRYRLAMTLADAGRHSEYLAIYDHHYQSAGDARLDCHAAAARIAVGATEAAAEQATELWLVGRSQVDECDPVFDHFRETGLLDATLYRQRYDLALSARDWSLARYLARSLDAASLDVAERWLEARDRPEAYLAAAAQDDARTAYALERLARRDAESAAERWRALLASRSFDAADVERIERQLALWAARQHRPDAHARLRQLPAAARDAEVRRWLMRTALARRDWPAVAAAVNRMPQAESAEEDSQYWLAQALKATGDEAAATSILETLAGARSYYGFLAADELGRGYAWRHVPLAADEERLEALSRNPSLVRARELFYVGQEGRGRSEWSAALRRLDDRDRLQSALLAHRWNWHSRAMATLAAAGHYDDLELRYPLAWPAYFGEHAGSEGIPRSWAYGVARSESLFMPDIRSAAGAIGLMQLMPATGRLAAGRIGLPWQGMRTLTDPQSNIRLGTHYLGHMLERFGSRAAATAAYNAGPNRVEKWLPEDEVLDARVWIENIPYNETRQFVRRVLAADAIFHWRLTGETRRLSAALTVIPPRSQQFAASDCESATGCSTSAN